MIPDKHWPLLRDACQTKKWGKAWELVQDFCVLTFNQRYKMLTGDHDPDVTYILDCAHELGCMREALEHWMDVFDGYVCPTCKGQGTVRTCSCWACMHPSVTCMVCEGYGTNALNTLSYDGLEKLLEKMEEKGYSYRTSNQLQQKAEGKQKPKPKRKKR